MDIDVGFWLSLALLITVLIWLADRLLKLRQRRGMIGSTVETSNSLISVLLIVLVIRSFIVEPFTIPSGSMLPTLQVHDFILVNKFSYGLRLPVTNTRIIPVGEPERGDVMVFKFPEDTRQNFIKRVVGLPGDHVAVRDNVLYINNEAVRRELVNEGRNSRMWRREYIEYLGDTPHRIWQEGPLSPINGEPRIPQGKTQGEWQVPQGHYLVMGDNRDNSNDSRFWGVVPERLIVGEAFLIWMHWDPIFSLPSFSRNGAIDKIEKEKIEKEKVETE